MKFKKELKEDWDFIKKNGKTILASSLILSLYYFALAPYLMTFLNSNLREDIASFLYSFISYVIIWLLLSFIAYRIVSLEMKRKRNDKKRSHSINNKSKE